MMKTRLLFTLLLSIVFTFAYTQSLVLSIEGETLEPNEEIVITGSAFDPEIVAEIDVTNTSASAIDVMVMRYEENMVPGSMSYFCWGLCYSPTVNLSLISVNIPAGVTNEVDFSAHYLPGGISGQSTISFVLFDNNNPNDSTMVTFLYQGLITGMDEYANENIRAYPNPANNNLTIEMSESQSVQYSIMVINVNGEVVKTLTSLNQKVDVNTSDLANGIYIYQVTNGKKVVSSERFVVQH